VPARSIALSRWQKASSEASRISGGVNRHQPRCSSTLALTPLARAGFRLKTSANTQHVKLGGMRRATRRVRGGRSSPSRNAGAAASSAAASAINFRRLRLPRAASAHNASRRAPCGMLRIDYLALAKAAGRAVRQTANFFRSC